jgi:hypothetical protein
LYHSSTPRLWRQLRPHDRQRAGATDLSFAVPDPLAHPLLHILPNRLPARRAHRAAAWIRGWRRS